eukprot:GILK01001591.1.p1 GENE.GILK01001591.1~~GILK01001591.1.p1  ORF type:complete len:382 (+),score=35.39 GILK01001591.1:43-1188(+)
MQTLRRVLVSAPPRIKQAAGSARAFASRSVQVAKSRTDGLFLVGAGISTLLVGAAYTHERFTSLGECAAAAPATPKPAPQPTVLTGNINTAGYLTIHLSNHADAKAVARVVSRLQTIVDTLFPADERASDEPAPLAGVAFSPSLWQRVTGQTLPANASYKDRNGAFGSMPATGGDIFVHVKTLTYSQAFEILDAVLSALPPGSVAKFEDRYGWGYKDGRDLSGFLDGTENPSGHALRQDVGLIPGRNGSYLITQLWIHDRAHFNSQVISEQENWVGRTKEDSAQLDASVEPLTSHRARMVGHDKNGKKINIIRQSMPFGTLSGEHGLFFIAYANSPDNFDYMLDRMVGVKDSLNDSIMRFSKCTRGNYWYVPSTAELAAFK